MGWAKRARAGLGYRTRLAARRRWAAHVAYPKLIAVQLGVFLIALLLAGRTGKRARGVVAMAPIAAVAFYVAANGIAGTVTVFVD